MFQHPLPAVVRLTYVLLSVIMLGFLLWIGGGILAPLGASVLIAMLLLPLNRWLERKGVGRVWSAMLCILLVVVCLSGLISFFTFQILGLQEQLPMLEERSQVLFEQLQQWVLRNLKINPSRQIDYLEHGASNMLGSSAGILGEVAGIGGNIFKVLGIMPIYIFFILYYRDFFGGFVRMALPPDRHKKANLIMAQIETVSQGYLVGLFSVIVIVALLNTLGLMLLGIENALFFGALASVLAVIPYIGIFIGSIFPAAIALITKDSAWYAVGVILVMGFVQTLEGNFITPNIVGSRVSVNPFAAILALLVGGSFWGAAGMVMAIPYTAIAKVVFDNIEALKPLGYLIGEPRKQDVASHTHLPQSEEERILKAESMPEKNDSQEPNPYEVETDLKDAHPRFKS